MSKASQRKEAERQKRIRAGKASDNDVDALLSRNEDLFIENPVKYWTLLGQRGPKFKAHPDDSRLAACVEHLKAPLAALLAGLGGYERDIAPSMALTFEFEEVLEPPERFDDWWEDKNGFVNGDVQALASLSVTSIWSLGHHAEMTESPLDWLVEEAKRCETEALVWALGIDHPTPFQLVLAVSREGAKKATANINGVWVEIRQEAAKRILDTHKRMAEHGELDEFLAMQEARRHMTASGAGGMKDQWGNLCDLVEAAQGQGANASWALACRYVDLRRSSAAEFSKLKGQHDQVVSSVARFDDQVKALEKRAQLLEQELARARTDAAAGLTAHPVKREAAQAAPRQPEAASESKLADRMAAIFG